MLVFKIYEEILLFFLFHGGPCYSPMRAIGGLVIAIAVIFGTTSYASAYYENIQTEQLDKDFATNGLDQFNFFVTTKSPLVEDSSFESKTNFDAKIVYEIVLIPHPCDPLYNALVVPDDPNLNCKKDLVDDELLDFINEIAIRTIGFPIDIDEILFSEVTNLDELEEKILQLDNISELIFEHEAIDVSTTTSQFEEQIQNSDPESAEYLESKLEEKVEEIRTEYQIIKDMWKEKINELQNNSKNLSGENPGMKAKILKQDIEKMKIRFELKQDKIKNTDNTMKKIKTAVELNDLKKDFQNSMNKYEIIEKTMKYGAEKDKKLEQLKQKNVELFKSVLFAEAKHNDKKLDEDYLKKIDQEVGDLIKNSAGGYSESPYDKVSEIVGSDNGNNGDGKGNGNGNGSDNGKGSGNDKGSDKNKGQSKGKGSDKGKGKGSSNGKGNSKK